jgi:hypothetical protein
MLIRRIVASACALCIAVPAAAAAKPAAPGDTKYDLPSSSPPMHNTPVMTPAARQTTSSDDTNGWQIAALAEAALLATVAVGGAVAVSARRERAPRVGV